MLSQAAEKYAQLGDIANEGVARNNLADCLRELGRLAEARKEVLRAIQCNAGFGHATEPWKPWANLANIEKNDKNLTGAARAKQNAVECYLSYRRDGGENLSPEGQVASVVVEDLLVDDVAGAAAFLQALAANPELPDWARPYIQALQAIVAGSRDPALAAAPELDYAMAAEILLLIETLEGRG